MMTGDKRFLKHTPYVPYDPDVFTYVQSEGGQLTPFEAGGFHPFEYNGWVPEMKSWHESCYIHAGLNPTTTCILRGPDVLKMLSDYFVNSFTKFPIGRSKHCIMTNDDGYTMIHGMCLRLGAEEFITYWLWPWVEWIASKGYNVTCENITGKVFLYQLGGPKSLEVIEAACKEDLHDVSFLGFKDTIIAGKKVRVFRIGMCGTLAYEVHGLTEDAHDVYNALLEAGKAFGMERLGRHAYRVVHTEGGFPQINYHFPFVGTDDFFQFLGSVDAYGSAPFTFEGSAEPDKYIQFRNPVELGWGHMINFDHEFPGKEALKKIMNGPHREMVTLEWNEEDVLDVYRAQFNPNVNVTTMEWCEDYQPYHGSTHYHEDLVVNEERKPIGISSGRMFSPFYKKMISLCSIDSEYAKEGTEITLIWGNPGTDQKNIRVKVARYPYVDKDRNEDVDTNTIPRLNK